MTMAYAINIFLWLLSILLIIVILLFVIKSVRNGCVRCKEAFCSRYDSGKEEAEKEEAV